MGKRSSGLTLADAQAHAERHGYKLELSGGAAVVGSDHGRSEPKNKAPVLSHKPRQNKTEQAYGLILEAMKRRGEIADYRPFGIRLEWGCDPATGKPMVYSPDFFVIEATSEDADHPSVRYLRIKLIEVKGAHVWSRDLVRFKGCRAEWGHRFAFEMWQKEKGEWSRLL